MLLYGGHGGGKTTLAKYLGQLLFNKSSDEIEACMLRGHPQLTEEKILGSLDISQLIGKRELRDGKHIDVIWNEFVESPWKIIDEVNRLTPYAQNILLSLLAEGSVKYHNSSLNLKPFTVYATMNPKDEANTTLSLPFLDRFALALPITMPDYESLITIGKTNKSAKAENLSNYLPNFNLQACQHEVNNIIVPDEVEYFIDLIISEFRLCHRVVKEVSVTETVDSGLCKGCQYENVEDKVCNKIVNPLSVRVKEDLYRYAKALAWFLGANKVSLQHVVSLSPYLIWHRSNISNKYKKELQSKLQDNDNITVNTNLEACKAVIHLIVSDFDNLKSFQARYNQMKKGKLNKTDFQKFIAEVNDPNQKHFLVELEMKDTLNNEYEPSYKDILEINNKIEDASNIETLNQLKDSIITNYNLPNRQFFIELIDKKIKSTNNSTFSNQKFGIQLDMLNQLLLTNKSSLTHKINSIYHHKFDPALMDEKDIFIAGEDDFDLRLRLNPGNEIEFTYKGSDDTEVFKFLKSVGLKK